MTRTRHAPALSQPPLRSRERPHREGTARRARDAARPRLRVGSLKPLGEILRYEPDSLSKIAAGGSAVTPTLALQLARHVTAWSSTSARTTAAP